MACFGEKLSQHLLEIGIVFINQYGRWSSGFAYTRWLCFQLHCAVGKHGHLLLWIILSNLVYFYLLLDNIV
jgi:hypothetical protein